MVVFAFRYALGRRSSAVAVCVDELKRLWPELNRFDRQQIRKEIVRAIKFGEAGARCDEIQWEELLTIATGQPPWKA